MKQKLGELIFQTKLSTKELKRLETQNKELEYENKVLKKQKTKEAEKPQSIPIPRKARPSADNRRVSFGSKFLSDAIKEKEEFLNNTPGEKVDIKPDPKSLLPKNSFEDNEDDPATKENDPAPIKGLEVVKETVEEPKPVVVEEKKVVKQSKIPTIQNKKPVQKPPMPSRYSVMNIDDQSRSPKKIDKLQLNIIAKHKRGTKYDFINF